MLADLARPDSFPDTVEAVEVHQTHISAVFLGGTIAYKIKKPVQLAFLDFSSLEKRRHFCEEEVRLNRRLAPHVYLGVVPVTADAAGLRFEGSGPVVEWAVKMQRLPARATLEARLDDVTPGQMESLARKLGEFHRAAAAGPDIAQYARLATVAGNMRDNFEQCRGDVDGLVSQTVFDRLRWLHEQALANLGSLIEVRAERARDTHGDLHLDHVYWLDDWVIIDCIEFNERFRFADPVSDLAFLVMDLDYHGRPELARWLGAAYFQAADDAEGAKLLPLYAAYRAVVRAKVAGLKARESEVADSERAQARQDARGHWLLALGQLETPTNRPALLLVGGLPGSGKSTLARALVDQANFVLLRTDVLRKQLPGAPADRYDPTWTETVYAECRRLAEKELFQGRRVVIDGNFRLDRHRQDFFQLARAWGVPVLFLHCQVSAEVARARLAARRNDASDADWSIRQLLAAEWQPPSPPISRRWHTLNNDGSAEGLLAEAGKLLEQHDLAGPLKMRT